MKYIRQHLHKICTLSFFRLNSQIRCIAFTDEFLPLLCLLQIRVLCHMLYSDHREKKTNNFRKFMVMVHVQIKDTITEALSTCCILQMEKLFSLEESDYWWLNTENMVIWQWSLSFTVSMDRWKGHLAFGFNLAFGFPTTFSYGKVEK